RLRDSSDGLPIHTYEERVTNGVRHPVDRAQQLLALAWVDFGGHRSITSPSSPNSRSPKPPASSVSLFRTFMVICIRACTSVIAPPVSLRRNGMASNTPAT